MRMWRLTKCLTAVVLLVGAPDGMRGEAAFLKIRWSGPQHARNAQKGEPRFGHPPPSRVHDESTESLQVPVAGDVCAQPAAVERVATPTIVDQKRPHLPV